MFKRTSKIAENNCSIYFELENNERFEVKKVHKHKGGCILYSGSKSNYEELKKRGITEKNSTDFDQ